MAVIVNVLVWTTGPAKTRVGRGDRVQNGHLIGTWKEEEKKGMELVAQGGRFSASAIDQTSLIQFVFSCFLGCVPSFENESLAKFGTGWELLRGHTFQQLEFYTIVMLHTWP